MGTSELILEYFRVICSPQLIVTAAVISLVLLFRREFRTLFARIASIKLPGGGELAMTQSERLQNERSHDANHLPELPDASSISLYGKPNIPPEVLQQIRGIVESEQLKARLWEFRFLNFFLAPQSHRTLDLLASMPSPPAEGLICDLIQPFVPLPEERGAILLALRMHQLVAITQGLVEVTNKGRDYLTWRGSRASEVSIQSREFNPSESWRVETRGPSE